MTWTTSIGCPYISHLTAKTLSQGYQQRESHRLPFPSPLPSTVDDPACSLKIHQHQPRTQYASKQFTQHYLPDFGAPGSSKSALFERIGRGKLIQTRWSFCTVKTLQAYGSVMKRLAWVLVCLYIICCFRRHEEACAFEKRPEIQTASKREQQANASSSVFFRHVNRKRRY